MYEIAVIGAGPAGAGLALLMARAGAAVLLVERTRFDAPRAGESSPPEIRRVLASMGLENLLQDDDIALDAPAVASVWGDEEPAERHHICSAFGPALHLDRSAFDEAVARRAQKAGASVRLATRARVLSTAGDGHTLLLEPGGIMRARYLVLALGRRPASRARADSRRIYLDNHTCLLAVLSGEASDGRTLIEAVREGWFYAARMPRARMIVALTTLADLVPKAPSARAAFWQRALATTRLIAHASAGLKKPEHVSVRDARASVTRLVGGDNWCVLGDARFAPEPLSGQGTMSALDDARFAAPYLLEGRADRLSVDLRERSLSDLRSHILTAARIYGAETRFSSSEFWSARQRALLAAGPSLDVVASRSP